MTLSFRLKQWTSKRRWFILESIDCMRRVSMRQSYIPSFLGIGATKAGTTWLFHQLRHHPEVYVLNEVHYFDRSPDYPSPNALAKPFPWQRLSVKKTKQAAAEILQKTIKHGYREGRIAFHWHFGIYNDKWYLNFGPANN